MHKYQTSISETKHDKNRTIVLKRSLISGVFITYGP